MGNVVLTLSCDDDTSLFGEEGRGGWDEEGGGGETTIPQPGFGFHLRGCERGGFATQ